MLERRGRRKRNIACLLRMKRWAFFSKYLGYGKTVYLHYLRKVYLKKYRKGLIKPHKTLIERCLIVDYLKTLFKKRKIFGASDLDKLARLRDTDLNKIIQALEADERNEPIRRANDE
jgi:hypothetical protein